MPKHPTSIEPVKMSIRPGEGVVLEVSRKIMPRPDGTVGFQIGLDLGNAPVPERRYVADAANLNYSNGYVYLIFWQKKISGGDARSMVILALTSAAVLQFLQGAEAQIKNLEAVTVKQSIEMERILEDLPTEPAQTVCLAANVIASAWSGREACIDFYHASPFVIGALPKHGKFAADPVVRITLPTGVLISISNKMASFKTSFPKDELESFKSPKSGEASNA